MKNKTKTFAKNTRKTRKNKLTAIILLAVGVLSMIATDGDATLMVWMIIIAIPLFLAKKNYIS